VSRRPLYSNASSSFSRISFLAGFGERAFEVYASGDSVAASAEVFGDLLDINATVAPFTGSGI